MARRRAAAQRLARLGAALAPSSGSGDAPPSAATTTNARRPPAFNISLKRETTQLPPRRFTPADDPPGTHSAEVTAAEAEFFRDNGFLVKRGLLSARHLSAAQDFVWAAAKEFGVDRGSPDTWWDPQERWGSGWVRPTRTPLALPPDEELEAGGARVKGADGLWAVQNIRSAHSRSADIDTKFTQPNWKLHDIGTGSTLEPWVKAILAEMRPVVGQLLGEPLRTPETDELSRARGVYTVWPSRSAAAGVAAGDVHLLGPHCDNGAQQLNYAAYLDEVPEHCAGLSLWPGSHRTMYYEHLTESNFNPIEDERYKEAIARIAREVEPVTHEGGPGDVIFWHGRTVHSQGQHGCASPRIALFGDFCHDRPIRQPEPAEWYYTHKLEFTEDWPPREDMFEGWRV